jgi:hypothetical protein
MLDSRMSKDTHRSAGAEQRFGRGTCTVHSGQRRKALRAGGLSPTIRLADQPRECLQGRGLSAIRTPESGISESVQLGAVSDLLAIFWQTAL